MLAPSLAAPQVATPSDWVGCWSLQHLEPWAPEIPDASFPSGTDAPAPRGILLDRLPGARSDLAAAPGMQTYRAEWLDPALRTLEAWALRNDDHVVIEGVPGVRAHSVLLEGPPAVDGVPGRWFFRRTDSHFPETRAIVAGRPMECPEGEGPHTVIERADLEATLGRLGDRGTFVVYETRARRFVRVDPSRAGVRVAPTGAFRIPTVALAARIGALDPEEGFPWDEVQHAAPQGERDLDLSEAFVHGVPWVFPALAARVPTGAWPRDLGPYGNRQFGEDDPGLGSESSLRISADEKVEWLVGLLRDASIPAARAGAGGADPVEVLEGVALLATRGEARVYGSWGGEAEDAVGSAVWAAGWVREGEELRIFAGHVTGPPDPLEDGSFLRGVLDLLEEVEAIPPSRLPRDDAGLR